MGICTPTRALFGSGGSDYPRVRKVRLRQNHAARRFARRDSFDTPSHSLRRLRMREGTPPLHAMTTLIAAHHATAVAKHHDENWLATRPQLFANAIARNRRAYFGHTSSLLRWRRPPAGKCLTPTAARCFESSTRTHSSRFKCSFQSFQMNEQQTTAYRQYGGCLVEEELLF